MRQPARPPLAITPGIAHLASAGGVRRQSFRRLTVPAPSPPTGEPEPGTRPGAPPSRSPDSLPEAEPAALAGPAPGVIIGTDTTTGEPVHLPLSARFYGTYLLGGTGRGKSSLIETMVNDDLNANRCIVILDPHRDLTDAVLRRVPRYRYDDVVVWDVLDPEYAIGYDLFHCADPTDLRQRVDVQSQVRHLFERLFGSFDQMPQLAFVLRHVTTTMLETRGTVLDALELLLALGSDRAAVDRLVSQVKSPFTRRFWQRLLAQRPREQAEAVNSTLNKLDEFITNDYVRHIVTQRGTRLDVSAIINGRKLLFVKLSDQHEDVTRLVGTLIIQALLTAGQARVTMTAAERMAEVAMLYADEFDYFATRDFATILEGLRKRGFCTLIAHQERSSLSEKLAAATLQVANIVTFALIAPDAKELAGQLDHTPTPAATQGISRAPVAELLRGGRPEPLVTEYLLRIEAALSQTPDWIPPDPELPFPVHDSRNELRWGKAQLDRYLVAMMDGTPPTNPAVLEPLTAAVLALLSFRGPNAPVAVRYPYDAAFTSEPRQVLRAFIAAAAAETDIAAAREQLIHTWYEANKSRLEAAAQPQATPALAAPTPLALPPAGTTAHARRLARCLAAAGIALPSAQPAATSPLLLPAQQDDPGRRQAALALAAAELLPVERLLMTVIACGRSLAANPIRVSTAAPAERQQTVADREAEVAALLTSSPRYQAHVRLDDGERSVEHTIRTLLLPPAATDPQLIAALTAQSGQTYGRRRSEIDAELQQRFEQPNTHATEPLRVSVAPQHGKTATTGMSVQNADSIEQTAPEERERL